MSNNGISGYSDTFLTVLMLIVGFRYLAGQTPLFQGVLTPFWRSFAFSGQGDTFLPILLHPFQFFFLGIKKVANCDLSMLLFDYINTYKHNFSFIFRNFLFLFYNIRFFKIFNDYQEHHLHSHVFFQAVVALSIPHSLINHTLFFRFLMKFPLLCRALPVVLYFFGSNSLFFFSIP